MDSGMLWLVILLCSRHACASRRPQQVHALDPGAENAHAGVVLFQRMHMLSVENVSTDGSGHRYNSETHEKSVLKDDAIEKFESTSAYRASREYMSVVAAASDETLKAGEALRKRKIKADDKQFTSKENPKVMYAIFTSKHQKYRDKLDAVMQTWGASVLAQGRLFALAGRGYPKSWQGQGVSVADCADSMHGLSCKEASLIAEGFHRGADWLMISGEDNYIDTQLLEKALQTEDPQSEIALGCRGCGKGLSEYGIEVSKHGGLCGGCGYVISRAALAKLMQNGQAELVAEYGSETQCDMSTSKALLSRGVTLKPFPGNLQGNPIFSLVQYNSMLQSSRPITLHYISPPVMRWLHAKNTNSSDAVQLEALAFDHGCMPDIPGLPVTWKVEIKKCRDLA